MFLMLLVSHNAHAQIYEDFNVFCLQNFGAITESLTYQIFGNTLAFVDSGRWSYESEQSAAISVETSLPARSYIEYGTTSSYGSRTSETDRFYYIHLHYLTNLQPNTIYHYRMVATDERGQSVPSADMIVQTRLRANVVYIPGNLGNPPYVLNSPNTTYVLTQDLVAPNRAFTIRASGITLDLNGHEVTYDDQPAKLSNAKWNDYLYSDVSTFGIYCYFGSGNVGNIKIVNGKVKQGRNNGTGDIGMGFNPIIAGANGAPIEISGLTLEYSGISVDGLIAREGNSIVHHNVVTDRGTGIVNRSQGVRAIWTENSSYAVHHNLIRRTRHQGIVASADIFSNEIYVDSYATNAFGISPARGNQIYSNKIFGSGYHVVGIGWDSRITVSSNFIYLVAVAPTTRSDEYGADSSVNGIRLTQYTGESWLYENNLYQGNTIVVKGRDGAISIRGVQFASDPNVKNLVFRDNTIKAESLDTRTAIAHCVVTQGISDRGSQQLPVFYRNNTFISNTNPIAFGDSYGSGGNHHFEFCRFVRTGSDSRFRTVRIGYWIYDSFGNRIIDPMLETGTDLQNPLFDGDGRLDYSVGHFLQIIAKDTKGVPIASTAIQVYDNTGLSVSTMTDGTGAAAMELIEYAYASIGGQTNPTRTNRAGHNLRIAGFETLVIAPEIFAIRNNQGNAVVLTFRPINSPQNPKNLRLIKK